jgi:prepilin-type N-terminal cleavage/methylation domain-containing protein
LIYQKNRGFTLLEVLVSLLLLSIMLLGLDVLEVYVLHKNLNTYYANMALQQLHNLEQRLKMVGAQAGVEEQLALWEAENQAVLPLGRAVVSGSYPGYTVTLFWGEKESFVCEQKMWERAGCISESFTF